MYHPGSKYPLIAPEISFLEANKVSPYKVLIYSTPPSSTISDDAEATLSLLVPVRLKKQASDTHTSTIELSLKSPPIATFPSSPPPSSSPPSSSSSLPSSPPCSPPH